MTLITSNSKPLSPGEIADLVIAPVFDAAVAGQAATVTTFSTSELRVPIVGDGQASWTPEAAEIEISEPVLSGAVLVPRKLAVLVPLSNELIADAHGDVSQIVGDSVTRAIARKIDSAFFAATTPTNGMKAIGSVTGVLDSASTLGNLDVFIAAISELAAHGHQATTIAVSPATFQKLATLKVSTGSAQGLLQPTATESVALQIAGLPVVVSAALADDTAYVVDNRRIVIGVRSDVDLQLDSSVLFSSDRSCLRATMRLNAVYPSPEAIVKITLS